MLTKKDVEDVVVKVIKDVVIPSLETVATKKDVEKLENRVDSIDRKLDLFVAKSMDHDIKLANHEKRIKRREQTTTVS